VTLDDLRVFIRVYETGNLSAVARSLCCTQSAVSQHIKRLENETGLLSPLATEFSELVASLRGRRPAWSRAGG
jgi:DNA-binding MarR family transcriptional regulator